MTIAAVATPPGEGAIAVVRVSGPNACGVARAVLRRRGGGAVGALEPRRAWIGVAVEPGTGRVIDEVLVLWMPGPASYTREDVLEIQCHGGHVAARRVLEACLESGARLARPGEFTLRAFLNGRIDLVQAESVLDVIRARSDEALRVHEALLAGALSRDVERWQEALTEPLALLEAHLDFPEEDIGPLDADRILEQLRAVASDLEEKLGTWAWGRTAREGFTAVLVGVPNTGKSSLLNRLLGEDRAIVTEIPGTTRDLLEGWVQAGGLPVRIVDTAGLRPAEDRVEEEGVRRARKAVEQADCVLLVCDGSRGLSDEEREEARTLAGRGNLIPVVNKVDLGRVPEGDLEALTGLQPVCVSAKTGEGIGDLLQVLGERAGAGRGPSAEAPLTRERHRYHVAEALGCLRRAVEILEGGLYPEVAASEIHGARRHLAELLGWGAPEDVLDRIFSQFCIGK